MDAESSSALFSSYSVEDGFFSWFKIQHSVGFSRFLSWVCVTTMDSTHTGKLAILPNWKQSLPTEYIILSMASTGG